MKRLVLLLVLAQVLFSVAVFAADEVTPDDFDRAISGRLEHPYLYFGENDKPAIRELIENDTESRDVWNRLCAEANRLLYTPVEDAPPRDKNPRFTGDWGTNHFTVRYRENALTLAFLYQMTGERKYADKAFEFADRVCDMENWTDRAHQFPIIYSRVMPWNVPDDQVVFDYDIYAAETAQVLGTVYDWLYPVLTVRQRDRIRGALLEKAILRVKGTWDYHWWAWAYRCNWLTTCASGAGTAALAILTENPELTDVVAESYKRIWKTFDEIGIDGGWQEGVGYSFANHYQAVKYGIPLKRLTKNRYSILNHPKIQEHPVSFYLYCWLPPKNKVDFGDTGNRIRSSNVTYIYNCLTKETKSPAAAWWRENNLGAAEGLWDLIWPRPDVQPALPKTAGHHFRTIDYIVMRSDFTSTDKMIVACKAGKHSDPHHGHLDCGDFVLHWQGQTFIRGIGNIPYDEKCFDDLRWTYPQASSVGQNVVFVNGEKQIPGKWRGKPMDETIGGEVLEYRPGKAVDYALLDPTKAYPSEELKNWRRHVLLDKPEIMLLLDEVTSDKGAEIAFRFHQGAEADIQEKFVYLEGDNGNIALIPVSSVPFRFKADRHGYLPVQANARFRWIDYIDTEVTAKEKVTRMAHIAVPVIDRAEAEKIAGSAVMNVNSGKRLEISFAKEGATHSYSFEDKGEGFRLAK